VTIAGGGDHSLRGGFIRATAAYPLNLALFVDERGYSYAELDQIVRRWCTQLIRQLGAPPKRVGVFGSRSLISYAGALTASYLGATYVPLNPRFPASRIRAMAQHAGLDAIIVDKLGAAKLPDVLDGLDNAPAILAPDTLDPSLPSVQDALSSLSAVAMDAVAYLLFTSGSTGSPKGVPILHSNVRAYIDWAMERYQFRSSDRFSQTFEQTFDLAMFDLFVAWESGACVYAMSPVELLAPVKYINRHGLTVWFSVPSVPAQMQRRNTLRPASLPTLRWSLFCGEALPASSASAWQRAAPASVVENLYGPTELTISCTVYRWDDSSSPELCVNGNVPIGTPHPGLHALLIDEHLRPVAAGETGELCISGAQTSPGYWHDAERTAERFVDIGERAERRLYYRTGDRARCLSTGDLVCLGRTDYQVKVLGFRVELGEIEAVLRKVPAVSEAVALPWPVHEGAAQGLVAFVSQPEFNESRLRDACRAALPDYMVPGRFVPVMDMPLNSNGKVDRNALAALLTPT
jgi:amino acid adenylation domain-containing protein